MHFMCFLLIVIVVYCRYLRTRLMKLEKYLEYVAGNVEILDE
jgi:hypothetical protein